MKSVLQITVATLLAILNSRFSICFAQGNLTPLGAPAPTMLTLSQIEPRTPISSAPFTITQPGSYYLTTNLICNVSNAITITVSGVTLDLSGFMISSSVPNAASGGTAVLMGSGLTDITISNGHIRSGVTNNGSGTYSGGGFGSGIYYSGNPPVNVLVSRVSVSGCLFFGINLNDISSTVAESCTVQTVGGMGIVAVTIRQSSALDCGGGAISCGEAFDCQGQSSGNYGIVATTALNCAGTGGGSGAGVIATTAQNCYGFSGSSGTGVNAIIAENCYGECAGGGSGVFARAALNCYGNCHGNGNGLSANNLASGCFGYSASGIGLFAFIASTCQGETATGTALSTTHNVNSF